MPPKAKVQREDIINTAKKIASENGIDAVTAREVARQLHVSVGPIFTYFDTMEELRGEVLVSAKKCCQDYLRLGLGEPFPLLAIGRQYLRFAKEEPELFRLLFLTPGEARGCAMKASQFARELALESLMQAYDMDGCAAESCFRDVWLVVFSLATLIVTDDCPYTGEEMNAILSELNLCVCKAFKEIPGLPEGEYDRDSIFEQLVKK